MDFDLDHEQQLFRDSVARMLADHYAFHDRQQYLVSTTGWSPDAWRRYAELGVLALDCHGAESSREDLVHLMITMQAFGRVLALEPYIASVVQCGSLLRMGGSAVLQKALLPAVEAGTHLLALAAVESQSRYNLADVATRARRDGADWLITGHKAIVDGGDTAGTLLVSARIEAERCARHGIGLFAVRRNAVGVATRAFGTYDGHRAADVTLSGVRVTADDVIGVPGQALPLLERAQELAIVALSAEAVGCMDVLLDLTVDHLRTREQFGRPIGSFQALQHRAVDMLVAVEQARSMLYYATMMAANSDPLQRARAIAATKIQIGKSARTVGQGAIQLHGGIGMTAEYRAGHYFKRLTAIETLCGDTDHHVQALARMGGLFDVDEHADGLPAELASPA